MAAEKFEVVVIGTGWHGLIGAKTYLEFKPDANLILVDDQASIGGVWCAEKIYPTLFAQIKYGQFEYSCFPMRKEGITADGYISGKTIHEYLNDFAREYDLVRRARLRTKVVTVDRLPGGGWRLNLDGKPAIECAKLIYSSGPTSHPVIPSWPQSNFNSPIIHSSDTGSHLGALGKIRRATVVGAAKSAYDAVFLLLKAGVKVDWIIREDGSGPLAIVPPTLLGMVTSVEAAATRIVGMLSSSIMCTRGPGYQFFQRTPVGRALAQAFWKGLTWVSAAHAGYAKSPNAQKLRPLPHGNGIFWTNAGLGVASVPDFWKVFHSGDCTIHLTEISSLTDGNIVSLRNGAQYETDYIVLCTGFDKSYQTFSKEQLEAYGIMPNPDEAEKWTELETDAEKTINQLLPAIKDSPLKGREYVHDNSERGTLHGPSRHYRRLIIPSLAAQGDRSIYFPGFIHTIYTPLVSEVQALWGVAFLLGLQDLPSQPGMEREVAEWNVWARKRYLAQGRKHAYCIWDWLSYIDLLLEDLGIKTQRKSNMFSELFLPILPKHYHGLIDEFRQSNAKKLKTI